MKRAFLFFAACLCFSLSSPAEAQRSGRGAAGRPVRQHPVKEYKAGETYSLGDIVNLNAEGNKLTVESPKPKQLVESKSTSIQVKIAISGELQTLAFTFGRQNSGITLLAGQTRIAASKANFADEIVTKASAPALVSRFRTSSDTGTLVLDTNERPLVLEFEIPSEFASAPRQLDLKDLGVGHAKYSLIIKLNN